MYLPIFAMQMPGAADTVSTSNAAINEIAADMVQTTTADAGPNFLDMAMKGGWLMIPLLLLSLLAVYIFVERVIVLRKASKNEPNFMERVREYITDGKYDAAIRVCQSTKAPYADMIEKGINSIGRPAADVRAAMENVGNLKVSELEKGFTMLGTISSGAPMIGFLGTVTGMIRAFYDMAEAGSAADITLLSNGIYQALTTTVAGLIVGIIAMFAYNYLVGRLDKVVNRMEAKTIEFMDIVNAQEGK